MKNYTHKNLKDAIEYLDYAIISEMETVQHDEELVEKLRGIKRYLTSLFIPEKGQALA